VAPGVVNFSESRPATEVAIEGATHHAMDALESAVVTRGVLLDGAASLRLNPLLREPSEAQGERRDEPRKPASWELRPLGNLLGLP